MSDIRDFVIAMGVILLGVVLLIAAILWVGNLVAFPGTLAEIEQLRIDAAHVDPVQAEDTIGQVTQWNQTIRSSQAYDRMFLIGIIVPDDWQKVEPIEVPQR